MKRTAPPPGLTFAAPLASRVAQPWLQPGAGRRRVGLGLGVLGLHLALLGGWMGERLSVRAVAPPARLSWVTLARMSQPELRRLEPAVEPSPNLPRAPKPAPARRPSARPLPSLPLREGVSPTPPGRVQEAAALPAKRASEPELEVPSQSEGGRLMNGLATRQAVRQIGSRPLLAETAAQSQDTPLQRRDQALSQGVQQAGKGDCLKGEGAGGGMGLLSLPFLAAAALTGQCAR